MSVYHIFHGVGDKVARRKRIKHTVMPHCNAVVDGDCIEFGGKTAEFLYFSFNDLSDFMQMRMTGHELCE